MKQALNFDGNLVDCTESTVGEFRCVDCKVIMNNCNEKKFADGRMRDYYFAHPGESPCSGSLESYIHAVAKIIIQQGSRITLPGGNGRRSYTTVDLEYRELGPDYRPDAFLDNELVIEVCYRNPKTPREKNILRRHNLDAVEIDLSHLDQHIDYATFVEQVLDGANREYINRRKVEVVREPLTLKDKINLGAFILSVFLGIRWLWLRHQERKKRTYQRRYR